MTALYIRLANWLRDEEGATGVEYGLLVALIAAVIIAIVATLGGQIATAFSTVSRNFPA
jgi:pilus assembly protein Flp/PilA